MTPDATFAKRTISYGGRSVALADLPKYAKFYDKLASGRWERHTLEAIRDFANSDTVVIDIGAWIGVTPLYAAQTAKAVIAIEPDPACVAILRELALGQENLAVIEGALSSQPAVEIHAVEGFGSSETSILDIGDGERRDVPGIAMETILELAGDNPLFVKIDIEGYEFAAGDEIRRLRGRNLRAVQIALHPQLYEKSLPAGRLFARLRTALAVWRLSRVFGGDLSGPGTTHFSGAISYIVFGVLLRRVPKGADFLFVAPGARRDP